MTTAQSRLGGAPSVLDLPLRVDETGVELKRGAFLNTIALLASNFRGIFTFLVARLLGPAVLGLFSVAWATTDLISKIGIVGLDNAIMTFIARSEAVGDRARSRMLFRLAVGLAVTQSAVVAVLSIVVIRLFGHRFGLQTDMVSAQAIILWALPDEHLRVAGHLSIAARHLLARNYVAYCNYACVPDYFRNRL